MGENQTTLFGNTTENTSIKNGTHHPLTRISKAKNKEVPNVVICIDNNLENRFNHVYNSLKKNTGNFHFHIVCDKSVSDDINKWRDKATIYKCMDVPSIDTSRLTCKNKMRSKAMFYRYFIPTIIPCSKILYTDCDVVFEGDISGLFDIELSDNLVAAPEDPLNTSVDVLVEWQCNRDYRVQMGNGKTLFASGLLLFDCKKWKKEKIWEKMVYGYSRYPMQDMPLYNWICYNRILMLDKEWCAPANYMDRNYCGQSGRHYDNAKCWHWNGDKPWVDKSKCKNTHIFDKYDYKVVHDA